MSVVLHKREAKPGVGLPRHVAVIMDGNGRWAKRRALPRHAGHRAGVKAARKMVETCGNRGIDILTLFAFSSENWLRPENEVGMLMSLFVEALQRELDDLHRNNVKLTIIGERSALKAKLQDQIAHAERVTRNNNGLNLVVAVSYGGRWDVVQAARELARDAAAGRIDPDEIDERLFERQLALKHLPDPDLFIRTGGERRISNFLLWNLSYTELYFSDVLWPDFTTKHLDEALTYFFGRKRRYGRTAEQVEA